MQLFLFVRYPVIESLHRGTNEVFKCQIADGTENW